MARRYLVTATANTVANAAASDLIEINPYSEVTTTGTNTSGQTNVTSMGTTTGITVGALAFGPGIRSGTTVAAVVSSTVVTLSNTTTASASANTYAFLSGFKTLRVIRWWWRPVDNTLDTAQVVQVECRRMRAYATVGTGGVAANIAPADGSDAAASFTANVSNTTRASGTTIQQLDEAGAHIYNGYEQQLEIPPTIIPGDLFVFSCTSTTLQGTVKLSFGAEVEELGTWLFAILSTGWLAKILLAGGSAISALFMSGTTGIV